MGMLDRYKKKGGFLQLLTLIETSNEKKQQQFLSLIAAEDPNWEKILKTRMLTFSKVMNWPQEVLMEVLSRLTPLTLAGAIHGEESSWIEEKLASLPSLHKRKITDLMSELKSNPGEKAACQVRILGEVRGFVQQGIIKFDKFDPEMVIPDNIEDLISSPKGQQLLSQETSNSSRLKESSPVDGSGLDFSRADLGPVTDGVSSSNNQDDEVKFLRRKVNVLQQEINSLKYENGAMKEKLVQIKKIV